MSMLGRFADIITVNVHALLDRAENPERMLAHLVRAMEEGLAAARMQGARAIAGERSLRRDLDQHRLAAQHWQEQARRALVHGREDLARRALAHKIDHDGLASALEIQHRLASKASAEVKASLLLLKRRLAEARQRQSVLLARQRAAEVRVELERCVHGNLSSAGARFEQLERRLLEREDDLLAQAEVAQPDDDLEAELRNVEQEKRIEEELEALKKEAGTAPSAPS